VICSRRTSCTKKSEHGTYQKTDQSDIHSIVTGMVGFKGHVHVSFGTEITLTSDDAEEAAALVDSQIIQSYLLQGTNHLALQVLQGGTLNAGTDESARRFESRIAEADPAIRAWLLQMYANPVISLEAFASSNDVLVKNCSESQI